jgi:hypothetical protein
MRSRTFLMGILLVLVLCGPTLAQQAQQRPNETGWLLEITYLKGTPPAYERVRLPGSKTPGDWFARFGAVAGWQLPSGAQPIRAVRIANRLRKDETIKIRVSVMSGEKHMDTEETVATYELRENEKITVDLLKNFGVEPFEIRAFRTEPLSASQPTAINKTTSVEIIAIEQVASDMPECRLTLHNLSLKSIEALFVDIVDGERKLSSGMPQGLEGRPLMLGGETVQVRLPLIVKATETKGAYAPAVSTPQQFVIASAVFADGTTEGLTEHELQSGAGFQSVKFGRRVELQRALPLFTAALQSTDSISSDGVARFHSQLEELNLGVTDAELVSLQQQFPTHEVKFLKVWVEFGTHIMRKEMLERVERYQSATHREDFKTWLTNNLERYSNWQQRLEPTMASLP